jgi:hypothetical protein
MSQKWRIIGISDSHFILLTHNFPFRRRYVSNYKWRLFPSPQSFNRPMRGGASAASHLRLLPLLSRSTLKKCQGQRRIPGLIDDTFPFTKGNKSTPESFGETFGLLSF